MPKQPGLAFICRLIQENGLEAIGVKRFIFYPGMLFGAMEKWWGKPGFRHSRHEGLDLCFFQTASGKYCRMDESIQIPMAEESQVVHMMDDFLGRTVVASQGKQETEDRELLTIYAHIQPDVNLRVGDGVAAGEIFANIAAVDNPKISLLPHLHLSMAWSDQLPDYPRWTWKKLNQCGSKCFVDPLERICMPQKILPFEFETDLAKAFVPCSRLTGIF